MTAYTLDTNILIILERQYPRDIFSGAWDALESLAGNGEACVCTDVHEETKRGGDELYAWARALAGFVCEPTNAEVALAAQISRAHPGWVRETTNAADPFLVAHAAVDELIIVTEEKRAGNNVADRNQKVPNVASEFGVETVTFFEFARMEGWKF